MNTDFIWRWELNGKRNEKEWIEMRLARVNEYELIVMNVEYDGFIREAVIIATIVSLSLCVCM